MEKLSLVRLRQSVGCPKKFPSSSIVTTNRVYTFFQTVCLLLGVFVLCQVGQAKSFNNFEDEDER